MTRDANIPAIIPQVKCNGEAVFPSSHSKVKLLFVKFYIFLRYEKSWGKEKSRRKCSRGARGGEEAGKGKLIFFSFF